MTEIIPAILTDSEEELVRLVHVFERAGVTRVHLDICDGVFVPTRTISGHEQLKRLDTKLKFDVHLMVQSPESQCPDWCPIPQVDRVFIHVETTSHFAMLCEHAKGCQKIIGAAINPETPMEKLEAVVGATDLVQFMTVHPGAQGREFVPEVLERITAFHAAHPNITIAVDGGITPTTAPQCAAAGASLLVSGSYIVKSIDPGRALKELQSFLG